MIIFFSYEISFTYFFLIFRIRAGGRQGRERAAAHAHRDTQGTTTRNTRRDDDQRARQPEHLVCVGLPTIERGAAYRRYDYHGGSIPRYELVVLLVAMWWLYCGSDP